MKKTSASIPGLIYGLLALGLLPWFRFERSPDGISYLTIADLYAQGRFSEAVNGYWGPMQSWLLAVPVALGFRGVLVAKLLSLAAGLFTLYALRRLILQYTPQRALPLLSIGAVMIVAMALHRITPDLLLAGWLLLYFSVVLDPAYGEKPNAGWIAGLVGGLAFLTKSYCFVFFLGHFALVTGIHAFRHPEWRSRYARMWAAGMLVFCLISGGWIWALSNKYGRLTLARNGEHNLRMRGPESTGYWPAKYLVDLPSPGASNPWLEPNPDTLPKWEVRKNLSHQAKIIASEGKEFLRILTQFTFLWWPLILAYILISEAEPADRRWMLLMSAWVSYPAGYLLVMIQDRYLWAMSLLLLVMAGVVYDSLERRARLPVLTRLAVAFLLVVSFLAFPLLTIVRQRNTGWNVEAAKASLAGRIPAGTRIASCGNFEDTVALSYEFGWRYHGITRANEEDFAISAVLNPASANERVSCQMCPPARQTAQRLKELGVTHVLVWPNCESVTAHLAEEPPAPPGAPRIFRWDPEGSDELRPLGPKDSCPSRCPSR